MTMDNLRQRNLNLIAVETRQNDRKVRKTNMKLLENLMKSTRIGVFHILRFEAGVQMRFPGVHEICDDLRSVQKNTCFSIPNKTGR